MAGSLVSPIARSRAIRASASLTEATQKFASSDPIRRVGRHPLAGDRARFGQAPRRIARLRERDGPTRRPAPVRSGIRCRLREFAGRRRATRSQQRGSAHRARCQRRAHRCTRSKSPSIRSPIPSRGPTKPFGPSSISIMVFMSFSRVRRSGLTGRTRGVRAFRQDFARLYTAVAR